MDSLNNTSKDLSDDIRTNFLNNIQSGLNNNLTIIKMVCSICDKLLADSSQDPWRGYAYSSLWHLSQTEDGLILLEDLEKRSTITKLAQQFLSWPDEDTIDFINDDTVAGCALGFITCVADRLSSIRNMLAESRRIPFILSRLEEMQNASGPQFASSDIRRWWNVLSGLVKTKSKTTWGVEMLLQSGFRSFLANIRSVI